MTTSIEFRHPGVEVQEVALPRDTGGVNTGRARSVIAGRLRRGPVTPTVVNSWLQFQNIYGSWSLDSHHDRTVDAVYSYFSNAGSAASPLTIVRVVGDGSEAATLSLDPFKFEAASPGTWANGNLKVTIKSATAGTGRGEFEPEDFSGDDFRTVDFVSEDAFHVFVELGGSQSPPERYYNLSLDPLSRNFAEAIINNESRLLRIVETSGTSVVDSSGTFGFGKDGTDFSKSYESALGQLDNVAGPILLYVASLGDRGDVDLSVQDKGVKYVTGRGDSFCVVDIERQTSRDPQDIVGSVTGAVDKSPFAAAYYPWIQVVDPLRGPTNIRKTVPPGGAVLGAFATTDAQYGPWQSPAGTKVIIRNAIAVDRLFDSAGLAYFNSSGTPINVLRPINGAGVCIMGARTLNQANADRYVSVRRSLNYITANLRQIAESGLFSPNGPDLWARLTVQMSDWLGRYYQQGALRGAREAQAFRVVIDESNNTPSTIAAGELHIEIGVAVEFPAEFVIIRLVQHQTSVRN